uniref:Uncharacterized protein n=1 Tax=Anguilla anguilla TaxID=7936 RepID=A0A0E9XQ44_ANGAN
MFQNYGKPFSDTCTKNRKKNRMETFCVQCFSDASTQS